MRKQTLLLMIFCLPLLVQAQELTGIWRGHFRNNDQSERFSGTDDRYRMEVQIAQTGPKYQAVTYSYKSTIFYGKADAEGSFNHDSQKVLLREKKITEVKMIGMQDACIMTCFLKYSKLNDEEFLEGTFTSVNTRDSSDCGKGIIFLHKVPESDFYVEPFVKKRQEQIAMEKKKPADHSGSPENKKEGSAAKQLPQNTAAPHKPQKTPPALAANPPKKTNPAIPPHSDSLHVKPSPARPVNKAVASHAPTVHPVTTLAGDSTHKQPANISMPDILPLELKTRSNEVVRTINVNTRDLILNIYDDGAIDNDSVTVYYDHKKLVSHARLSDEAIVVKLHLDENADNHEIVMVADNLGDIPPNTSLMVVKAGDKRYEVRIVSTEQKNAVVVFHYQKPE